jgi:hypothetical protein
LYGLYVALFTVGIDSLLIVLSLFFIQRAYLSPQYLCLSHLSCLGFLHPSHRCVHGPFFWETLAQHRTCSYCLCVPGGVSCAQFHHLQCQVQAHQGRHAQDTEEEKQRLMILEI